MLRDLFDALFGHDIDMWCDMMEVNPIFWGQTSLDGKIQIYKYKLLCRLSWMKSSKWSPITMTFGWDCFFFNAYDHIWLNLCKIIHMWLHQSWNACCHFGFLENLMKTGLMKTNHFHSIIRSLRNSWKTSWFLRILIVSFMRELWGWWVWNSYTLVSYHLHDVPWIWVYFSISFTITPTIIDIFWAQTLISSKHANIGHLFLDVFHVVRHFAIGPLIKKRLDVHVPYMCDMSKL